MTTVKEKYGFLPTSVWNLNKGRLGKLVQDKGKARNIKRSSNAKYLPSLKFSEFNPELAKRIILYWSNKGDTILDPFAGRSTRMVVASMLGRNYMGFEISPIALEDLKEKRAHRQLSLNPSDIALDLRLADGCLLDGVQDNSVDFIFTCPPYWNLERYESVPGQLSDCLTYEGFLERVEVCAKNCYRVLKPSKFVAWVVADFRKEGFKLLHVDTINLFKQAGFLPWDIVISVLRSPFAWCQIGKCEKQKYTSKTHEFVLIFKKPSEATQ